MMKKTFLVFSTASFISISLFMLATAPIAFAAYSCPNYSFQTDLQKGSVNRDVRVVQEILNLDRRTIVSQSGPGSKGNETSIFGVATREALKRFQALFIEYIGVANGKFGPKTRTAMNAVCQGPFFTGGTGSVYDSATTTLKDIIDPIVAIAGPETADVTETFRAFIGSNEPIQTPTLAGLIITNATAADIRKISSTTFSFTVTPNTDASGNITLQLEADSIMDIAGNKNATASNEWVVRLTGTTTPFDPLAGFVFPNIDLPFATSSSVDCLNVASVNVTDTTNPCYGKVPMTNDQNMSEQQQQDQQMMQMLQQLLQSLQKLFSGGSGGPPGQCECPPLKGQPTTFLAGKGGVTGGALMTLNPGNGDYTGFVSPFAGVCGQQFVKGKCINPQADNMGRPILFTIPPGQFWTN